MQKNITKKNTSPCLKYSKEEVNSLIQTLKDEYESKFIIKKVIKNNENIGINILSEKQQDKLYHYEYAKYILNEFNSSITHMITRYINNNQSFPTQYKNEYNFRTNLLNLFKCLLMNEIEVCYFTILIDEIGWNYNYMEHWLYFSILGIITKKLCSKENILILLINIFSRKNSEFIKQYTDFMNNAYIKDKISQNKINAKLINKRFIELSKPINTYCRNNYINTDGIIDKIVKMSQPYFKDDKPKKKRQNKICKNNNQSKINNFNDDRKIKRIKNNIPFEIAQFDDLITNFNKIQNGINFDDISFFGDKILLDIDDIENNDIEKFEMTLSNPASIDSLNLMIFEK